MQETQVQSLGQEDALEKEMATHFLQYSCLGNPMLRGAWWDKIHIVAKSPCNNLATQQQQKIIINICCYFNYYC